MGSVYLPSPLWCVFFEVSSAAFLSVGASQRASHESETDYVLVHWPKMQDGLPDFTIKNMSPMA